ncbi:unnamed protein product [Camellia sinensis]
MDQKVTSITKPVLENAAQSLFSKSLHLNGVLNVADLGCAAGPNTFSVISTVKECVAKNCKELNCQTPELQVYMNDLPGNDFNTLFKGLSEFCGGGGGGGDKCDGVSCYVMGVPGSFHSRLFLGTTCIWCIPPTVSIGSLRTWRGVIDEVKLDSFNVPYYIPSAKEVQDVVERQGSFKIENIDTIAVNNVGKGLDNGDVWVRGEIFGKAC